MPNTFSGPPSNYFRRFRSSDPTSPAPDEVVRQHARPSVLSIIVEADDADLTVLRALLSQLDAGEAAS